MRRSESKKMSVFDWSTFSKQEKIKVGVWLLLISSCVMVLTGFRAVFSNIGLVISPGMYSDQFGAHDFKAFPFNNEDIGDEKSMSASNNSISICNFSAPKSDFCEIAAGSTRIHSSSSTVFIDDSSTKLVVIRSSTPKNEHYNNQLTSRRWFNMSLKPYARKQDSGALSLVRKFTLVVLSSLPVPEFSTRSLVPKCTVNHSVPAIVFSTAGYTNNHFHAFTDVLVPLYLTSRPFDGHVQFLVANYKPWWPLKFDPFLRALSNYPIVNLDADPKDEVRCFPRGGLFVGLKAHKEFGLDPALSPPHHYSMRNFTHFIRTVYSLPRHDLNTQYYDLPLDRRISATAGRPMRLLIVSRKESRVLLNEAEVAEAARKVGFEVAVATSVELDGHNIKEFSRTVNSYDVYVGVHGAGLTNIVFLPERAVLIQIVPLGLGWLAEHDFEVPSKEMNLRYLKYKICDNESSLETQYKDPRVINLDNGWKHFKDIYLVRQNVRLDVTRFTPTLLKATELLSTYHIYML